MREGGVGVGWGWGRWREGEVGEEGGEKRVLKEALSSHQLFTWGMKGGKKRASGTW